jgi:hypothetical protein
MGRDSEDIPVRQFKYAFAAFLFSFLVAVSSGAQEQSTRSVVMAQIQHAIASAQGAETVNERTDAAELLATLTRKMDRKEITEQTIAAMTSLLDSPDDSVRYWVATALGNLGPYAKVAIPELRALLPRADCLNGAITSASAIRYALQQMGVTPPPPPNCVRTAG